jgi:hypothetical protein
MPSSPIRSVGSVLSSAPELGTITRQARKLLNLQSALARALPQALTDQAAVATLESGTAVVLASNGTVAAKLKQMSRRLLQKLRQQDPEISSIQVRVQEPSVVKPLPQKRISLSPSAVEALDSLSRRLESSPLRTSIEAICLRHATPSEHQKEALEGVKSKNNQQDNEK